MTTARREDTRPAVGHGTYQLQVEGIEACRSPHTFGLVNLSILPFCRFCLVLPTSSPEATIRDHCNIELPVGRDYNTNVFERVATDEDKVRMIVTRLDFS